MTLKKQANSSTESSSGSSSDSSSSGSSSSSSGSGSSTSDTETTTSEESPRTQGEASSSAPAAASAPVTVPDTPAERSATRRSADAPPAKSATTSNKQQEKSTNGKTKTDKSTPAKVETKNKKQSVSSSEDDTQNKTTESKPAPPRRRSSAQNKPKTSATVTTRPSRPANRSTAARPATKAPPSKPSSSTKTEVKKPLKKKSIFSPDNSSESDHEDDSKNVKPPQTENTPSVQPKPKGRAQKASVSADKQKSDPPSEKSKEPETSSKQKRASAPTVPPAVKKKPEKNVKYQSKAFVSSCSSTDSESTGSSSSSDNESNAGSRKNAPAPKRAAVITAKLARSKGSKVDPVKTDKNTPTKEPTAGATVPGTDSDVENTKPASNANPTVNVTRKLTRSTSARKSRHVVGRLVNSDSDSDPEAGPAKRSASKSPVKRATVSSKGPPALMCPVKGRGGIGPILERRIANTSSSTSPTSLSALDKHQEPRCPLPGCDSLGHLSGRLEKHFTIEACPMYHNTTGEECKKRVATVRALQETRRKSQHALASRRIAQPSLEHRNYQLKVKEMRSKWKPPQSSSSGDANQEGAAGPVAGISDAERSGEREPRLEGFVSNYDLNLFREAQAAAAYKIEEELKNMPPSKGTRFVCMGKYCMEAWYQSPYPADAARLPQLYLCEFCLNHHKTATGITRHRAKCVWRHPPGDEVYRKGRLGVWQVDGRKHKQYCQQLCLLAKFFLDHKTLYYDVEPFLFYVMTLADSEGCHTVGYFSKEKNSLLNYNVSCILTLPPYQRQGYGRLLIDFSYLLTRVEGKIGSPEKPLSDLGLISYRSYWKDVLLQHLCAHPGASLSIRDLSQEMAINSYDIVSTLQALGMMKYWKGKHIILKRQDVLDEYMERVKRRGRVKQIDPSCLRWTPFVPPSAQGGS